MLSRILSRACVSPKHIASANVRWLKILAVDPLDPVCSEVFADHGHKLVEKRLTQEELLAQVPQYDGLIVRSSRISDDVIRAGTKLQIIGRAGAGAETIDVVSATRRGITVMNTPGGNTSAAAELTMSLLMAMARQIPAAVESLKGGVWDRKTFSAGVELHGKTVGVIGLGQIGTEVARRCQALGMAAIGFDPLVTDAQAGAVGVRKASLEEVWAASDFITLHTPLNAATEGLINRATLAKCKKGVFIINCAAGGIVAERDLLAALESGHVAGAALDVFQHEPPRERDSSRALIAHPRVVCTPHLGASTEEAQRKVARDIAHAMSDAFAARAFTGIVNAGHLALAHRPALAPYVQLAEAIGSLQGQLWSRSHALKNASIYVDVEGAALAAADTTSGDVAGVPASGSSSASPAGGSGASTAAGSAVTTLIKAALLKGLLPSLPDFDFGHGEVNLVNSSILADEASLKVAVRYNHGVSGSYANAVRVSIVGAGGGERTVAGSVLEGTPRVVQVGHWGSFPSFAPEGHVLMLSHRDRPGLLAKTTGVLSEFSVNIASLSVARQAPGLPSLAVITTDQRVPAEARSRIELLDGISDVQTASFGSHFAAPLPGGAAAAGGAGAAAAGL